MELKNAFASQVLKYLSTKELKTRTKNQEQNKDLLSVFSFKVLKEKTSSSALHSQRRLCKDFFFSSFKPDA